MNLFKTLGLSAPLLEAIDDLGFERPSEVQQAAIPVLLEAPTDMVAWHKQEQEKPLLLVFHFSTS